MSNNLQVPSLPPKRMTKTSQLIPIIIMIFSVAGALSFSGFFDDVFVTTPEALTPTRDIVGTWTTAFSTNFAIATDFSTFQGIENVGSENRTMVWTITPTNNDDIVTVNVEFAYSNRVLIPDSGYTPDVSPMQLTGIINGTQLTLTRSDSGPIHQIGSVGVFTFTTDQMQGTWQDHWSGVYEQNVYTSSNSLKLIKQ
jgi:hypothetical protein